MYNSSPDTIHPLSNNSQEEVLSLRGKHKIQTFFLNAWRTLPSMILWSYLSMPIKVRLPILYTVKRNARQLTVSISMVLWCLEYEPNWIPHATGFQMLILKRCKVHLLKLVSTVRKMIITPNLVNCRQILAYAINIKTVLASERWMYFRRTILCYFSVIKGSWIAYVIYCNRTWQFLWYLDLWTT